MITNKTIRKIIIMLRLTDIPYIGDYILDHWLYPPDALIQFN